MNDSELIAAAAKFHGIDVPVYSLRLVGEEVIIVVQPGRELSCKLEDLALKAPKESAKPPQNLAEGQLKTRRSKAKPAKK
jgi:hypothetical protein